MSIDIHINAVDAEDALNQLRHLTAGLGGLPKAAVETVTYADGIATTGTAPLPAQSPAQQEEADKPKATRTRGKKADTPAAEAPAPAAATDAEAAKQDVADEQAEVGSNREQEKPLTTEDVKAEMTAYVQKYGMPATQEDGPQIFQKSIGAPPMGESAWKLSLLPVDNQEVMNKAVAAWKEAVAKNPYNRQPVAA